MPLKFKEVLNWNFIVDEVSAGVYKVRGKDKFGRSVEKNGTDPEALIEECKAYAIRIDSEIK